MLLLLGGVFLYIFSGFAIDRSKKYIKTIKIDMKIDAVDPQAAADNPPLEATHCFLLMLLHLRLRPRILVWKGF